MQYEWTIVCNACGCLKSQGGFESPAILTNDRILQEADHNPHCPIAFPHPNAEPIIPSIENEQNDNVSRYIISVK